MFINIVSVDIRKVIITCGIPTRRLTDEDLTFLFVNNVVEKYLNNTFVHKRVVNNRFGLQRVLKQFTEI